MLYEDCIHFSCLVADYALYHTFVFLTFICRQILGLVDTYRITHPVKKANNYITFSSIYKYIYCSVSFFSLEFNAAQTFPFSNKLLQIPIYKK